MQKLLHKPTALSVCLIRHAKYEYNEFVAVAVVLFCWLCFCVRSDGWVCGWKGGRGDGGLQTGLCGSDNVCCVCVSFPHSPAETLQESRWPVLWYRKMLSFCWRLQDVRSSLQSMLVSTGPITESCRVRFPAARVLDCQYFDCLNTSANVCRTFSFCMGPFWSVVWQTHTVFSVNDRGRRFLLPRV